MADLFKESKIITERLIGSRYFVAVSSITQFLIDMAIWSLTAIAAS